MVESYYLSCGDHGANLDIWSADSGGGGIAASGLHLYHPGGLPRTLDLPHLCAVFTASQRRLQEVVEGKGQRVRLPQQTLWRNSKNITGKCRFKKGGAWIHQIQIYILIMLHNSRFMSPLHMQDSLSCCNVPCMNASI